MNRHDRRAAEARTRQGFADYDAAWRRVFQAGDSRAIGEGYMRGAKAEAEGIQAMILHSPGAPPPPRSACDIELSAAYGSLRFEAFTQAKSLATLVEGWPKVVEYVRDQPNSPVTGDRRHDARGFIFEMIVTNRQYESGDVAAAVGSAIIWLATTALPGGVIELGVSYKRIHYEITDIDAANRDFKFSLMLG